MRDVVDATIPGVTPDDLKLLDESTRKASEDITAMLPDLRQNTTEHRTFMDEIRQLRG
jgi:hypothetical protein